MCYDTCKKSRHQAKDYPLQKKVLFMWHCRLSPEGSLRFFVLFPVFSSLLFAFLLAPLVCRLWPSFGLIFSSFSLHSGFWVGLSERMWLFCTT